MCAEPQSEEQKKQISFAKGQDTCESFRHMYYNYTYQSDPRMIEMSFNCSNYQHQLKAANAKSNDAYNPVYQTIFLDKRHKHLWAIGQIDEAKLTRPRSSSATGGTSWATGGNTIYESSRA